VVEWVVGRFRGSGKDTAEGAAAGPGESPDQRTQPEMMRDAQAAVAAADGIVADDAKGAEEKRKHLETLRRRYRLKSLEIVSDGQRGSKELVHVRGTVNPTFDGNGHLISKWPPDRTVIETMLGPIGKRHDFQNKVLESPSKAGLPDHERAHLLGPILGKESSLGIYYAPRDVNQRLQKRGIEGFLRSMYAKRYPGAQFFLRAEAAPHPGTDILARVVYTLRGKLPGEPETEILQMRIMIGSDPQKPTVKLQSGGVDEDAWGRYTSFVDERLADLDEEEL
jgi:hypothetical protein